MTPNDPKCSYSCVIHQRATTVLYTGQHCEQHRYFQQRDQNRPQSHLRHSRLPLQTHPDFATDPTQPNPAQHPKPTQSDTSKSLEVYWKGYPRTHPRTHPGFAISPQQKLGYSLSGQWSCSKTVYTHIVSRDSGQAPKISHYISPHLITDIVQDDSTPRMKVDHRQPRAGRIL